MLPSPCEKCAPFNGAWMETEAGLKRCPCDRGKALVLAAQPKPALDPVMSTEAATIFAEMMAGIPFYPPEAGARSFIADEIAAMCSTPQEAKWLVTQMARRFQKWPGVIEMRAVFCKYNHPRDGVQAISGAVEDAFDREQAESLPAIAAAPMRQLAAGEPASAAASLNEYITEVAKLKSLDRVLSGAPAPKVPDIPVQRVTAANAITAADMERAEHEYRAAKRRALDELAKAEMGDAVLEAK